MGVGGAAETGRYCPPGATSMGQCKPVRCAKNDDGTMVCEDLFKQEPVTAGSGAPNWNMNPVVAKPNLFRMEPVQTGPKEIDVLLPDLPDEPIIEPEMLLP